MNRDELEIKLHEILEIVTSTPELLTLDIMCWVDKYAESLAPAKEVVSKDEANLIEESRVLGYQDDHIIRRAKDKLELSYDDGSYQKFMRAVVNGYKAEPGNR
ncbi:hypothetical protein, partial [Lacticaseibacillus saniviri]|uniref:hypothetical protein n=2 Tax=Lacticaseibacillus saniviri TaxID=931533 RepID=UPI000B0AEAD1